MENSQTNYTAMGGFELPSRGLIYDPIIESHVDIRSMTARDEMKRLNPSTTPYKTLANIIEGCLINKPLVSVYDMALGDYEYLLHKLRIVTYSDLYKMEIGCPWCGQSFDTELSLDSLEEKEFDLDQFRSLSNFVLPRSKNTISIKYQTPRILDNISLYSKELKNKFKSADIDFDTMSTLTECIDSINGEHINSIKKESFINSLPALDMAKILKNINELNKSIGLNTDFTVMCPHCRNEVKSFFRFGPEFFRPTNI